MELSIAQIGSLLATDEGLDRFEAEGICTVGFVAFNQVMRAPIAF